MQISSYFYFSSFIDNRNLILSVFSILYQYSTIAAVRFPLHISGKNVFDSNTGGGLNMDHSRVSCEGEMEFHNHHGGAFGGAMRIGELVLVSALMSSLFINVISRIYVCVLKIT